jgi:hypothetical protein
MAKRNSAKLESPEKNSRVKKNVSKPGTMEAVEFAGKVNQVKTNSVPIPQIQAPGDAIVSCALSQS